MTPYFMFARTTTPRLPSMRKPKKARYGAVVRPVLEALGAVPSETDQLVRSPTRSFCGFTEALNDGLIAVDQTNDDADILALAHFLTKVLDELLCRAVLEPQP